MPQVCFKPITWCIEMHHVRTLKFFSCVSHHDFFVLCDLHSQHVCLSSRRRLIVVFVCHRTASMAPVYQLKIIIHKNLTWRPHIDHIASKISKIVGIIARLRHHVLLNTLLQIYRSLIFPYTLYGLPVWGQASQCDLKKILTLQKRALRLIFFASKRSHAIPLFVASNIVPVNMLYFETVS